MPYIQQYLYIPGNSACAVVVCRLKHGSLLAYNISIYNNHVDTYVTIQVPINIYVLL